MNHLLFNHLLVLIWPTLIRTKVMDINIVVVVNHDDLPAVPDSGIGFLLADQLLNVVLIDLCKLPLFQLSYLPIA